MGRAALPEFASGVPVGPIPIYSRLWHSENGNIRIKQHCFVKDNPQKKIKALWMHHSISPLLTHSRTHLFFVCTEQFFVISVSQLPRGFCSWQWRMEDKQFSSTFCSLFQRHHIGIFINTKINEPAYHTVWCLREQGKLSSEPSNSFRDQNRDGSQSQKTWAFSISK